MRPVNSRQQHRHEFGVCFAVFHAHFEEIHVDLHQLESQAVLVVGQHHRGQIAERVVLRFRRDVLAEHERLNLVQHDRLHRRVLVGQLGEHVRRFRRDLPYGIAELVHQTCQQELFLLGTLAQ